MPPSEPMADLLSDAAALSDDESALIKRVVAGVARADAALYAAKRAGKDRVEVYWRDQAAPAETGGA